MSLRCCSARSIALMAVESCSKGIFALCVGHGKSPCFLRCCFSAVFGVDGTVLVFAPVDGDNLMECAF